jgi:hypothetical protein
MTRTTRAAANVVVGAILAALTAQGATARDISIGDIIGRWCGDQLIYTFSRTDMVVTALDKRDLKHPPHWLIDKVEPAGNRIVVYWKPVREGNSTGFELSGNKRTLIQQPQTEGDKGPRRVFHRC